MSALYAALATDDADATFDAFLALSSDDAPPLSAAEYRHVVQVLVGPPTPPRAAMGRSLAVIEHAKRRRRRLAQSRSAADALVRAELEALLSDAFIWNAVLSVVLARRHGRPSAADVAELLDTFTAAEREAGACASGAAALPAPGSVGGAAAPAAAADARAPGTRFPDAVSYNILLQTIARSVPIAQPGRTPRVPRAPASLAPEALRRHALAAPYTGGRAEQLFSAVWERMTRSGVAPTPTGWSARIMLYARLGRLDRVQQSVRAMHAVGALSTVAVNAALWSYARLRLLEGRAPAAELEAVREVYESMRYELLQTEVARAAGAPSGAPAAPPSAAVERVLGIDRVPRGTLPDRATYALLIRLYASNGDLASALGVLHDMVVTPGGEADEDRAEARGAPVPYLTRGAEDARGMAPSIDVYHALFAAFARYGTPPGAAGGRAHSLWNRRMFTELFEGYLRASARASAPRPAHGQRYPRTAHLHATALAPSARQLFWVLAALRRVSGDQAVWVLEQWDRVVRKFAPSGGGGGANDEGWYGFQISGRVQHVLAELEQRAASDRPVGR